ncbi:MAG TPA: hypothetical protein VFY58_01195 [Nocardioides sp.]|nr:hypothetical protein [Nocardioides sp.]
MIKLVEHLPPGTVGVEASGRVTDDDYREVLVAALQEALAREDVKLLCAREGLLVLGGRGLGGHQAV